MFNAQAMEAVINNRGIKYGTLARHLEMSETSFRNKRKGITEFTQSEISAFCDYLRLSETERNDIFFA